MLKSFKTQNLCEKFEKCGEIFHYNGCFQLICTDCDEKHFDFKEFLIHFKEKHCSLEEDIEADEEPNDPSSQPQRPPSDFGDFEAITLLSPDSPISSIGPSTSDKDVLETDVKFKVECDTNHSDVNAGEEKLALQLRKTHTCGQCGKTYVSAKSLKKHIQRKYGDPKEYSCAQCNEVFTRKSSLWKHEREKHIDLSCKICEKNFKTRRSLRDHLRVHDDAGSIPCQYEGCTKTFKNQRRLNVHKKLHDSKESYVCEVCGYRTIRKHTLIAHVRTHTGEKPYPCKICGKHFISPSMVSEHLATHATERRHVCDICGASFTRPKALYHHKPLHLGVKKFVCSVCGKPYAQRSGLSAHMRKHKINGKIALGLE